MTAQDMGSRHVSKKKNRRSGGSEMKRERKGKKKREKDKTGASADARRG